MVILDIFGTYFVKRHIRSTFNDGLHIFDIVSCPQIHQLVKGSKIAKYYNICTFLNDLKQNKLGNKVTYNKVCI